jgi:hypothetical protein
MPDEDPKLVKISDPSLNVDIPLPVLNQYDPCVSLAISNMIECERPDDSSY